MGQTGSLADGLGPAALSTLGLQVAVQLGEVDEPALELARRQQRVERSRGSYLMGRVRQLRGTGRRPPDLSSLSPDDLVALLGDIERRLADAVVRGRIRMESKYPGLPVQPRILAGDMLVSNNWGPFDHAMLAVEDARLVGGRWTGRLAQCVMVGCSTSTFVYPANLDGLSRQPTPWRLFLMGRAYNSVRVVRHRHATPELIARVVGAATGWTDGAAPLPYHIHLPSVLRAKPCLTCPAKLVGRQREAADRYVQLAEGRRDHTDARQMCSEMAFGAWVAGLVLDARDRHASQEEIDRLLARELPIRSARGCWPSHCWQLPRHVPDSWERVGVVGCVAVASGR